MYAVLSKSAGPDYGLEDILILRWAEGQKTSKIQNVPGTLILNDPLVLVHFVDLTSLRYTSIIGVGGILYTPVVGELHYWMS